MTDQSQTKSEERRASITIDEHFCKGCGLCLEACPQHIISISDIVSASGYYPAVCPDPEGRCTGCTLCAKVCPDVAIDVYKINNERGGAP